MKINNQIEAHLIIGGIPAERQQVISKLITPDSILVQGKELTEDTVSLVFEKITDNTESVIFINIESIPDYLVKRMEISEECNPLLIFQSTNEQILESQRSLFTAVLDLRAPHYFNRKGA